MPNDVRAVSCHCTGNKAGVRHMKGPPLSPLHLQETDDPKLNIKVQKIFRQNYGLVSLGYVSVYGFYNRELGKETVQDRSRKWRMLCLLYAVGVRHLK